MPFPSPESSSSRSWTSSFKSSSVAAGTLSSNFNLAICPPGLIGQPVRLRPSPPKRFGFRPHLQFNEPYRLLQKSARVFLILPRRPSRLVRVMVVVAHDVPPTTSVLEGSRPTGRVLGLLGERRNRPRFRMRVVLPQEVKALLLTEEFLRRLYKHHTHAREPSRVILDLVLTHWSPSASVRGLRRDASAPTLRDPTAYPTQSQPLSKQG